MYRSLTSILARFFFIMLLKIFFLTNQFIFMIQFQYKYRRPEYFLNNM